MKKNLNIKTLISLVFIGVLSAVIFQIVNVYNKNLERTVIVIPAGKCIPQEEICKVELGGVNVDVFFEKNIFYLKPFKIFIRTTKNNNIESIIVDFKMKGMDMGINRFEFIKVNNTHKKKSWIAKAILPICVNGRSNWIAEILVKIDRIHYKLSFPFEVKKYDVQ